MYNIYVYITPVYYHVMPRSPYNKRTPSSVNRCDDDDPRESRTISFFVRVRSGSEISIWHRWRAEGDPSCMRARTLRVAVGEDNVRAAVAAAGVNTPPTAARGGGDSVLTRTRA